MEIFFWGIFLGEIFWEDFLGGFFWEEFFGRNVEGIDLFVKILSQGKKEGRRISILRSASASSSHLKMNYSLKLYVL